MKRWAISVSVLALAACAGTDAPLDGDNNGSLNGAVNGGTNGTPNGAVNNVAPNGSSNGTPNGTTNGSTNNITPNGATNNATPNAGTNNVNNAIPEWRALVANADLTGDTSTWSILIFDGTSASSTLPLEYGSGSLAVAASADQAFVVDLDTGMALPIDTTAGTAGTPIDLMLGASNSAASANGTLTVGSGGAERIAQYAAASGGLGQQVPLPSPGAGSTLYVPSLAMDGNIVASVLDVSAMFPTTARVAIADTSTASLIKTIDVTGAKQVAAMGNGAFAVATASNGILVLREQAGDWNVDQTLAEPALFYNAEVQGVVMATPTEGVALTFDDSFKAYVFDSDAQTRTQIDGIALPTGLIGGSVSADSEYYFVGDYGIRNQTDTPWGVAIVGRDGVVLDHIMTDSGLPPTDIAAIN